MGQSAALNSDAASGIPLALSADENARQAVEEADEHFSQERSQESPQFVALE